MSVPGIVQEALEGEGVETRIGLGGEDELFVTPTRTLVYRGEGLLRDESIEEYSHDAERLRFSEGRRKTAITLEYPIEGTREFTVPGDAATKLFEALIEGVLTARGVIDDGEAVIAAYRFSELTLIVTDSRLVKHIGEAVYDEDFEEFRYEDVTDLTFETGNVAMQIVLTVDGRSERIKTPGDRGPEVRTRLENALWDYYGVSSNEELRAKIGDEEEAAADAADAADEDPFGSGLDPLGAGDTTGSGDDEATATAGGDPTAVGDPDATAADAAAGPAGDPADQRRGGQVETHPEPERDPTPEPTASEETAFEEAGFEPANSRDELAAEVAELRETVERQNELLAEQQRTIQQLIEELSRGR